MATKDKEQENVEIDPQEARRLADAVRRIDKSMADLRNSGLNRKAIVVLLNDSTGVSRRDINAVLNGLEMLAADYLERS